MSKSNENAGMHFIQFNHDYDEYKSQERQIEKKAQEEKRCLRSEQWRKKREYDNLKYDINHCGYELVEAVKDNIAYYALTKGLCIRKCLADVNFYIRTEVSEDYAEMDMMSQILYYLGLLAKRLDIDSMKLFSIRSEEIHDFFENKVKTILDIGEGLEYQQTKTHQQLLYRTEENNLITIYFNAYPFVSIDVGYSINESERKYVVANKLPNIVPLQQNVYYDNESTLVRLLCEQLKQYI